MRTLKYWLVLMAGLTVITLAAENPACVPVAREDWSKATSENYTRMAAAGNVGPILFLGDSITQCWSFPADHQYPGGKETWEKVFAPMKATNFGISGDRVEHLLWRLTEGRQLAGINPKVVVLMIGTNNLHGEPPLPPEQIAEGIGLLVKTIREKLPESRLLLLGVFPRDFQANTPRRRQIAAINAHIRELGDRQRVFFLDLGHHFLEADGTATREVLRDGLHLSPRGYEIWATAMMPYLQDLLTNEGKGELWGTAGE